MSFRIETDNNRKSQRLTSACYKRTYVYSWKTTFQTNCTRENALTRIRIEHAEISHANCKSKFCDQRNDRIMNDRTRRKFTEI